MEIGIGITFVVLAAYFVARKIGDRSIASGKKYYEYRRERIGKLLDPSSKAHLSLYQALDLTREKEEVEKTLNLLNTL